MAVHSLIVVRHGESLWNKSNRFCGWVDIPLSDRGKEQAKKCAKLVQEYGYEPDVVFTSKLTRSCQTANIILDYIGKPYCDISRSWRLNERHYGKLQGQSKNEVLKKFGKEKYMFWRRNFTGCPPLCDEKDDFYCIDDKRYNDIDKSLLPRGESLEMVIKRLLPYLNDTIEPQLQNGKTVLVVTHGSIARSLIKVLANVSDDDISDINVPNGIPLVFKFDENLNPCGSYEYLDPEEAKIEAAKVARQGFDPSPK